MDSFWRLITDDGYSQRAYIVKEQQGRCQDGDGGGAGNQCSEPSEFFSENKIEWF